MTMRPTRRGFRAFFSIFVSMGVYFPLGALLFAGLAYQWPVIWAPHSGAIIPLLGLIMFCMGLTLKLGDFQGVFRRWRLIILGLGLQYIAMPFAAWIAVQVTGLQGALAIGVILVGCCPGGTASNVICYLARGDTALSVTLTSVSTFLAVFMTPFLAWVWLERVIEVSFLQMMGSIFKLVILPVSLGLMVNRFYGHKLAFLRPVLPVVAMIAIMIVIALIVAVNADQLVNLAFPVIIGVILHNLLGLLTGYGVAWRVGAPQPICRTLAIETGMQNSGLAAALAMVHFSPPVALAAAVFSIFHNLSGAVLAAWWSRQRGTETS